MSEPCRVCGGWRVWDPAQTLTDEPQKRRADPENPEVMSWVLAFYSLLGRQAWRDWGRTGGREGWRGGAARAHGLRGKNCSVSMLLVGYAKLCLC